MLAKLNRSNERRESACIWTFFFSTTMSYMVGCLFACRRAKSACDQRAAWEAPESKASFSQTTVWRLPRIAPGIRPLAVGMKLFD